MLVFTLSFFALRVASINMPINQQDPHNFVYTSPHHYDPLGSDDYMRSVRYYNHYPDIMGYERFGNGWSAGDLGVWLLSSQTDRSGLGTIRVRFPRRVDDLAYVMDGDLVNGWFHPDCSHPVDGVRVFLTSFSPDVRIGKDGYLTFYTDVPIQRFEQDLYVPYSGRADTVHFFALRRMSLFASKGHEVPPPYEGPVDPEPGEL